MPTWVEKEYWDCVACDAKHIDGLADHCPSCGTAHNTRESKWYGDGPGSYDKRITDHDELARAQAGPNWHCTFCNGTDRNEDGNCRNCGASRTEGIVEGTTNSQPAPLTEPSSNWDGSITTDRPSAPTPPNRPEPNLRINSKSSRCEDDWLEPVDPRQEFKRQVWRFAIGGSILLLLGLVVWWLVHTRPVEVQVTKVEWKHTVTVERRVIESDDGFDEDRPTVDENAYASGSTDRAFHVVLIDDKRYHHTDEVQDGTREEEFEDRVKCGTETTPITCPSNNNGTRTCSGGDEVDKYCTVKKKHDVPNMVKVKRYEPYYQWSEWVWRENRKVHRSGTTTETSWPSKLDICLGCNVSGLEAERIASKHAHYIVRFISTTDDETFTLHPDSLEEFVRYPVKSSHTCIYSIARGINCDP